MNATAQNREEQGPYFVYIAECANGALYVGYTLNVLKRIEQHNRGRGGAYTKRNRPLRLLADWSVTTRAEAVALERGIKRLPRDRKLALVEVRTLNVEHLNIAGKRRKRWVTCTTCGNPCLTEQIDRDICRTCHRREESRACLGCRQLRHIVDPSTGLCAQCQIVASRPVAICSKCRASEPIYNSARYLCRRCHDAFLHAERAERALNVAPCEICGQLRRSVLVSRQICNPCWRREKRGMGICSSCGRHKRLHVPSEMLCKICSYNKRAVAILRKYIAAFRSAFPYNNRVFGLLISDIKWDTVNYASTRKIKTFGKFLQRKALPELSNWHVIYEVLPSLPATNRNIPKQIRACLLRLGRILEARGAIESHELFIAQRNALMPVSKAPQKIQTTLQLYASWLWQRQTVAANVRDHLEALASFWTWACAIGIEHPAQVSSRLIADYVLNLEFQWQCSCGHTQRFEAGGKDPPICPACDSGALTRVQRYARNTVRNVHARLFTFFEWAKLSRKILDNPVKHNIKAPPARIQHYPPEMIRELCGKIRSEECDPVMAIMLYLIIFHALTPWELRHAKMPRVVSFPSRAVVENLIESYCIYVPETRPSLGRKSLRRPETRVAFASAARPWLSKLLEQFIRVRESVLRGRRSDYLFVSRDSARHNTPISHVSTWSAVKKGTAELVGVALAPNILRKTTGVLVADKSGSGILRWLGWSSDQAFKYTWAPRELISPSRERATEP